MKEGYKMESIVSNQNIWLNELIKSNYSLIISIILGK